MKRKKENDGNGFEQWGGYMNAKITKLEEQYQQEAESLDENRKLSSIFDGVSIFVNGYSEPPAEVLRRLMLQHGGTFHDYQVAATTHVIATNLPNAKLQQQAFARVLRPEWIVDSVAAGKLLPIAPYLLCARSALQPTINFQPSTSDKGGKNAAKTAVESNFINEFYNNSRLHHLSTIGALLKQYVGNLKEVHNGVFVGLDRLKEIVAKEKDEGPPLAGEKVIMHIDMDSFFVSVALRERPELVGRPVAVTHARGNPSHVRPGADPEAERAMYNARAGISEEKFKSKAGEASTSAKPLSMSEIASCSYEARALGVRNGMYLGRALSICPGLVTVPYDFAAYTEVSYALYDTVAEYTMAVEAVSCDELFVDCTAALRSVGVSPMLFTKSLRADVTMRTRCPCSAGLGANKLQARLASKRAKPNGQYYIRPGEAEAFLREVPVSELPGVGWSTTKKLKEMDIDTCLDLQALPLATLKTQLGGKTGETLYKFCRGLDDRPVVTEHQRKSVSAEVNYGIRFSVQTEAEDFLRRLSGEVADRLAGLRLRGRCVTLKLMVRSPDAPVETAKFLGHGVCDTASKSLMLSTATSDGPTIADAVLKLYYQMEIAPDEMRGVGIQVSKLDPGKSSSLQSFLRKHSQKSSLTESSKDTKTSVVKTSEEPVVIAKPSCSVRESPKKPTVRKIKEVFNSAKQRKEAPGQLPPMAELDPEVISALPDDIRRELLAQYGANTLPGLSTSDHSASTDSQEKEWTIPAPDLTDTNSQDSVSSAVGTNMFDGLPGPVLRDLITSWVEAEEEPQHCDVVMLASHCSQQVADRHLDQLGVTLRCFWRSIRKYRQQVPTWYMAYSTVVEQVQVRMVEFYKYPLKVMQL